MRVWIKWSLIGSVGVLGLGGGVLLVRNHALADGKNELATHGTSGFEKALSSLKLAERLGSTEAAYQIGRAYYEGQATKEDDQTAMFWFQKAASKGHPEAMAILGEAMLYGRAVKSDPAAGAKLLKRAAESGSLQGMYDYGRTLFVGRGIEEDEAQGVSWMDRAAEGGLIDAAFARGGLLLVSGSDTKKGIHFLEIAAEKGSVPAKRLLVEAWSGAVGAAPDPQKAVNSLKKMVDKGDDWAMFRLGTAYARGQLGLKEDPEMADRLIREAAEKGNEDAKNMVAEIDRPKEDPVRVDGARLVQDMYGFLDIQAVVRNLSQEPRNARVQLDLVDGGGMILEHFQKTFFGIPPGRAQLLSISVSPAYRSATVRVRNVEWQ